MGSPGLLEDKVRDVDHDVRLGEMVGDGGTRSAVAGRDLNTELRLNEGVSHSRLQSSDPMGLMDAGIEAEFQSILSALQVKIPNVLVVEIGEWTNRLLVTEVNSYVTQSLKYCP